jgi:hypothetical protein
VVLQDIPSSDPVGQGDEDLWEMVGAATERCVSLLPATEEAVPEATQQETDTEQPQASGVGVQDPSPVVAVEQP